MSDVTKVLPESIKVWVDALRSGDYYLGNKTIEGDYYAD